MRPSKLFFHDAKNLFAVYQRATKFYKNIKNYNQYNIALKIKNEFEACDYDLNNFSKKKDDELAKLANKYGLSTNQIHNISGYICSATPAAIVQMCKRVRKQVQN